MISQHERVKLPEIPPHLVTLNIIKDFGKRHLPERALDWYRGIRHPKITNERHREYPFVVEVSFGEKTGKFQVNSPRELIHASDLSDEGEIRRRFIQAILNIPLANVLVIGAAEGSYAVGAALHGAKVYAFEPDSTAFESMAVNFQLNAEEFLYTPESFKAGISNLIGSHQLYTERDNRIAASLVASAMHKNPVTIQLDTIDHLIGNRSIPTPHIILMDVEGAEALAVEGMSNLLQSVDAPTEIFIELHPDRIRKLGSSMHEFDQMMVEHGYELMWAERRNTEILTHYQKAILN